MRRATGTCADATLALLQVAWSSIAALAIAPLQDVLNLGNEARMNRPGSVDGNWRWRCTDDQLSTSAFESLRNLTRFSSRSARLDAARRDQPSASLAMSPEITT